MDVNNSGFFYKPFIEYREVEEGLTNSTLIKGRIRVNQRNYLQCFVENPSNEEGPQPDLLIYGTRDRNRALDGDIVVVRIKPRLDWLIHESHAKDYPKIPSRLTKSKLHGFYPLREIVHSDDIPTTFLKKTAEVVYIMEQKANRKTVGRLGLMSANRQFALFSPEDSRIPRIRIPAKELPRHFFERPQDFKDFLYVSKILKNWPEDCMLPRGKLTKHLGKAGNLNVETEKILITSGIDDRPFTKEVIASLNIHPPQNIDDFVNFVIADKKELQMRRDLRRETIFTIDPATARDLDDALHIKPSIWNKRNCWEVGVHIADVTHFLKSGTELDNWAKKRGTSVYLVHKVIPMLPRILCEKLCSLNPGVPRLTFSVIWQVDYDGNVLDTWFGRSVICSCAKFAYEQVQDIIENPEKQFALSEFPTLYNQQRMKTVKTSVLRLNALAKKLRTKRISDGALRIELPRMRFDLMRPGDTPKPKIPPNYKKPHTPTNFEGAIFEAIEAEYFVDKESDTKAEVNLSDAKQKESELWMPRGVEAERRNDANFLVEEFMLLANMAVAKKIYNAFPDIAMLRNHPPPKPRELKRLVEKFAHLGIMIDGSTSLSIAHSLIKYESDLQTRYSVFPALSHLLMKSMNLAKYFCSGTAGSMNNFRHYALSVDLYTHFTSPIRRYPDVIVHRLLAAAMGYSPRPLYMISQLRAIAERCNTTKEASRSAGDMSQDLFLGLFVKASKHIETVAIVIEIKSECFDMLLVEYGQVKRIYLKYIKFFQSYKFGVIGQSGLFAITLYLKNENEQTDDHKNNAEPTLEEEREILERMEKENDCEERKVVLLDDDECPDDKKQTIQALSIVKVVLEPVDPDNSVKYRILILPTPDSKKLTHRDVEEAMKAKNSNS